MELQQLKYFKAVAETGKISDAAESLFMSAPALSTSVSRLEKELGFTLFDRTNNKIMLNQQGKIFLKHVNQVFSSLDAAMHEIQQSLIHQGEHISIACVNTAMWVNMITAFTSEFPQFTLSCATTTCKDLSAGRLSPRHSFLLASEYDVPGSYANELDSIHLFDTYPTVLLHKNHPLSKMETIHLRQLADEKIFMPTTGYPLNNRLEQLFALYNLPIPTDNAYSLMARQQMVAQNLGVAFFAGYPDYYSLPELCSVRLEDPLGPWSTRLYWRKNKFLTKNELAFRDFIAAFYGV